MGVFIGLLIFIALMATLVLFVIGLINRFTGKSYRQIWNYSLYSFVATCMLFILLSLVSSGFKLSDLALMLWTLITIAMFVFLILGVVFRKEKNSRNKHFIRAGVFFVIGFVAFFVFVFSLPDSETSQNQISAVDEKTEESSSETTEEEKEVTDKKAEEKAKAEKEESIEAVQKEKEKEESIEEAEAKKEESIEAAKAEEESIEKAEAEKKKEESIEAAKAEEESIEKAEAKKQEEEEKAEKEKKEAAVPKEGLVPVQLYRVVDGDTVNVLDGNGNTLKLRLLLIDTPETVHPNKPVEPYGKEASSRLIDILNAANQLYIEYDSGDKTDHYGRELVYLYADDTNVHETLLREGLARVGYVYEQQRYLSDFREAEQYAKDRELGIWSIPGYVNEGGEGFNSEEPEPEPTSEPATSEPATSEPAQTSEFFQNCTDLRGTYPDGVAQGHAAYQPKMDRDKDGWACE